MMLTLVGAGYGIGFLAASKIPVCQRPDVVIRPLAIDSAVITTYLLRPDSNDLSASLERFIRSEERRVGKERVSTCRSRWSPDHEKKKCTKTDSYHHTTTT